MKTSASSQLVAPRPSRMPGWAWGLIAAVLALAPFLPAVNHGFVRYDDPVYVTENPQVLRGLTWEGVHWAFTARHGSNWHPLTWLSHMADQECFGAWAGGHHLTSLLLHGASVFVLFLALRLATGALWRSLLVAALFGLHPLRVESVAWVAERKDVLCGLFWWLSILAYAAYARRGRRSGLWFGMAVSGFACALMSKPMAVTLPFVLLLLDVWPLGRTPWVSGAADGVSRAVIPMRLIAEKIPFFALSAASCVLTVWAQKSGGAVMSLDVMPPGARLENALVSVPRYLWKTVWPAELGVFYPHPGGWPAWQVWLSALFLAGITAAVLVQWKRRAFLAVGWFWFLGTLIPVIGLVQVGLQSIADRYTYLPSAGIFMAVVWGLAGAAEGRRALRAPLAVLAVVVLAGCAVLTALQVRHWRDTVSLFGRALAVTENNFVAHINLGTACQEQGRLEEAAQQYVAAAAVRPGAKEPHLYLAQLFNRMGRYDEALRECDAALAVAPDYAAAHNEKGVLLAKTGDAGGAAAAYREALAHDPAFAEAHYNLASCLSAQGRADAAVEHFRRALALRPDYADAHNNLATTLAQQGRFAEAAVHLEKALALRPDDAEIYYNLGYVLEQSGDDRAAREHFKMAFRLKPDLLKPLPPSKP